MGLNYKLIKSLKYHEIGDIATDSGEMVKIPWISIFSLDLPFQQIQIAITVCFEMIINKVHGQI